MVRNVKRYAVAGAVALGLAGAVVALPAHADTDTPPTCNIAGNLLPLLFSPPTNIVPANNEARPVWNCILKRDNSDNDEVGPVRALQTSLLECHKVKNVVQDFTVNGSYDDATVRAVRHVQGEVHIKVDGVYGQQTAENIMHAPACTAFTLPLTE